MFEAGHVDHLSVAKGTLDRLFQGLLSFAFVFEASRRRCFSLGNFYYYPLVRNEI